MKSLCEEVRNKSEARQVQLKVFLLEHGQRIKDLAKRRGISPGAMGDVLSGRRPKAEHIEWLIGQGIPAALLPEPAVRQKTGPKPKQADVTDSTQAAA